MKNLLLFPILFFTISVFGQSEFSINLHSGFSNQIDKYDYINFGSFFFEEVDSKKSFNYFLRGELEYNVSSNLAILTGVEYQQRTYQPMLALSAAYGALLYNAKDTVYMQSPHLTKHRFQLISLPASVKRYFQLNERHSIYFQIGTLVTFQMRETERYQDIAFVEEFANDPQKEFFSDTEKDFRLFGTSLEAGLGWRFEIINDLHLFLQAKANFFEYRTENEKFKKNGEILWKEGLLPISQASFSLGFQKSL